MIGVRYSRRLMVQFFPPVNFGFGHGDDVLRERPEFFKWRLLSFVNIHTLALPEDTQ